jgi:hypothetical protein
MSTCNIIELHTLFRTISSLTSLTAAINNQGHPTLAKPSETCPPYRPSHDPNDQDHNSVLNAVSTILVRKSEALAAIVCKPLPPANSTPMSEPNPYRIFILENTAVKSEEDPDDSGGIPPADEYDLDCGEDRSNQGLSNVAVVANPRDEDRYFDDATHDEQCILVKHGESHMPKILDKSKHWEMCLQIP